MDFLRFLAHLNELKPSKNSNPQVLTWSLQVDFNPSIHSTFIEAWSCLDENLHNAFTHVGISYSVAISQDSRLQSSGSLALEMGLTGNKVSALP
jgi:hypothetical protein